MWNDIETTRDLLNFKVVADTAAQLIVDSFGQPISVGVSGGWGTGKSSLVKMIGQSLQKIDSHNQYVFLEFNAWLYQGYDDARAALLQVVSNKLLQESENRKTGKDKAIEFAKRIDLLQLAKLLVPAATGAILGGTVAGPIGAVVGAVGGLLKSDGLPASQDIEDLRVAYTGISPELKKLFKERATISFPREIEGLRSTFGELLKELGVNLVLLIDDLDRCLPETAISTLEAMRLLLFTPNTAFIIAADEQMIRNAVRAHFPDSNLSEEHVTSYFDKLIQIPLRVPRPGITEIKGYMVMLFADEAQRKGDITQETLLAAEKAITELVSKAWMGDTTQKNFEDAFGTEKAKMIKKIDIAEQLANIMVSSDQIGGNPRLIKRFLNNLLIREAIAYAQDLPVVFNQIVKMQLFERCATPAAYDILLKSIDQKSGKIPFLADAEQKITNGEKIDAVHESWNAQFVQDWLKLEPKLGAVDLRPLLYLSREKSILFTSSDEISSIGQSVLRSLLLTKKLTPPLIDEVKKLGETEAERILNKLFRIIRESQFEIEKVQIAFHISAAYPALGTRLASFLYELPSQKISPVFLPLLRDESWAEELIKHWRDDPSTPVVVKNAIEITKHKK